MPHERVIAHLENLYSRSDDPWQHRTSAYEAAKYATTLDEIGPGPFTSAIEIGCGNGTLASLLRHRCRHLTLVECIPAALSLARQSLADARNVTFIGGTAPHDLPSARFDLVLLSEVLYFLTVQEISELAEWLGRHATGEVVAVNWTGPTDEDLDGTQAVEALAARLGASTSRSHQGFRIDVFMRQG